MKIKNSKEKLRQLLQQENKAQSSIKQSVNAKRHPQGQQAQKKNQKKTTQITTNKHDKLIEGKFRYLNEKLYTTTSDNALSLFQQEPHLFEQYHTGFRLQVSKWPVNPLSLIFDKIKNSKSNNKNLHERTIADFGCGEAELGRKLNVIGYENVHSFDLVQYNDRITVANSKKVPIPTKSADIAVFCLSLMGTDYLDFLVEANRVLKQGGLLFIAEVVSRISDLDKFGEILKRVGFRVGKFDSSNKMFVMFDCVKVGDAKKAPKEGLELKACKYKKR